jgi:hypothetical protein
MVKVDEDNGENKNSSDFLFAIFNKLENKWYYLTQHFLDVKVILTIKLLEVIVLKLF